MKLIAYLVSLLQLYSYVTAKIESSVMVNKLVKIKPVGTNAAKTFMALTEITPPKVPHEHDGRRHLPEDCTDRPRGKEVYDGPRVDIIGDYYDDREAKTVATVIIPDHIDINHFQVTTQVPYLTLGDIDAIGYHPKSVKGDHPSECEKIYQDHLAELYSDDTTDYSEESLEVARMPLFPENMPRPEDEPRIEAMYSDMDMMK